MKNSLFIVNNLAVHFIPNSPYYQLCHSSKPFVFTVGVLYDSYSYHCSDLSVFSWALWNLLQKIGDMDFWNVRSLSNVFLDLKEDHCSSYSLLIKPVRDGPKSCFTLHRGKPQIEVIGLSLTVQALFKLARAVFWVKVKWKWKWATSMMR